MSHLVFLLTLVSCVVRTDSRQKQVVVVGGGIAGLAAARKIKNCDLCDLEVTVFEARRDRYGGRVWSDRRNMPHARGVEAELGGAVLNMQVKDNPLINLTRTYELETSKFGDFIFVMSDGKTYRGKELADIYIKAINIVAQAVNQVKKSQTDMSMHDAVTKWVEEEEEDIEMDDPVGLFLQALPSMNVGPYSAMLYNPSDLDFGYEEVLLDGVSELVDRLVSGSGPELPLKLELRKTVRHIEIKEESHQVIIRTKDREQITADAVVVAVPASVLRSEHILFEPPLSKQYRQALDQVGMSEGNKLVVEFDEVFWPADVGVFLLAASTASERGFLQTWVNTDKLVGSRTLTGMILGPAAKIFENMTDDEVKNKALQQLTKLFGEKKLEGRNMTKILRSDWNSNIYSLGVSSFPLVGNNPGIWETLAEPVCPFVYFAGEHTTLSGIGSLHGAYKSGVRAADQFLSNYCDKQRKTEKKTEKLNKTVSEKEKQKSVKETEEQKSKVKKNKDEL